MRVVKRQRSYFSTRNEREHPRLSIKLNGSIIHLAGWLQGSSDEIKYSINLERYEKVFNDGRFIYGVNRSGTVEEMQITHFVLKGLPDSVLYMIIEKIQEYNIKQKKKEILMELVKANPFLSQQELVAKTEEVYSAIGELNGV